METVVFFVYLNFVLIGSSYVCFMNKKKQASQKKNGCLFFL